jgi:hypothetical protein
MLADRPLLTEQLLASYYQLLSLSRVPKKVVV